MQRMQLCNAFLALRGELTRTQIRPLHANTAQKGSTHLHSACESVSTVHRESSQTQPSVQQDVRIATLANIRLVRPLHCRNRAKNAQLGRHSQVLGQQVVWTASLVSILWMAAMPNAPIVRAENTKIDTQKPLARIVHLVELLRKRDCVYAQSVPRVASHQHRGQRSA